MLCLNGGYFLQMEIFMKKVLLIIYLLGVQIMAEVITLGGGCFWCVEAVYDKVKGVKSAVSGYTDGSIEYPTYEDVSSGESGHAEVVRLEYDEKIISLDEILDIFWKIHDPTTLNRQGNDVGTQYRSAIYYENEGQKEIVEASLQEASKTFVDPIVTQVKKAPIFYEAEKYHQDFYKNNPYHGYCRLVVAPKVQKLKDNFKENVK